MGVVEPFGQRSALGPSSARDQSVWRHIALGVILEERADALRRHGLGVETSVEFGNAADVLMGRATQSFTDLIVVGSRDLGPVVEDRARIDLDRSRRPRTVSCPRRSVARSDPHAARH